MDGSTPHRWPCQLNSIKGYKQIVPLTHNLIHNPIWYHPCQPSVCAGMICLLHEWVVNYSLYNWWVALSHNGVKITLFTLSEWAYKVYYLGIYVCIATLSLVCHIKMEVNQTQAHACYLSMWSCVKVTIVLLNDILLTNQLAVFLPNLTFLIEWIHKSVCIVLV